MTARRTILVLCPFPQGIAAGQRLKYEQYFADWKAAGFDVTVSSFMDRAMYDVVYQPGHLQAKLLGTLRGHLRRLRDLARVRRFDLVYVFMWVTPVGTSLMERMTRALARRLIYDLEDNALVGQRIAREDNPNPLARLLKGRGKTEYLIREADHVITSSPLLNDICVPMNRRRACTYISSSVDADRFVPANRYEGSDGVTIGWTGTYSTKPFLDLLRPVFRKLAERVRFKLRVIGNFDYDLPGVDLEVVRWSKEKEVEDLQAIDIGVYPLPLDDWVIGKSGLKAIQYMAFGLPVVASDAGITSRVVLDGATGILVRTEDEWLDALERLVRDPALRRRLGEAGRREVLEKYSTRVIAGEYRRVLEDAMGQNAMGVAG
jgi:glycosyltransferase involved in cell wall biosynthesis